MNKRFCRTEHRERVGGVLGRRGRGSVAEVRIVILVEWQVDGERAGAVRALAVGEGAAAAAVQRAGGDAGGSSSLRQMTAW